MTDELYAIVLAAGKGTRMKSDLAKVLHPVFFKPMVCHVLEAIRGVGPEQTIVVTGHQAEQVEATIAPFAVSCVRQQEQLGTGHAVLSAEEQLAGKKGVALILCGDTPLIQTATLRAMIKHHHLHQSTITVMTTVVEDPTNYGRIVANDHDVIERIVEEKDADAVERAIREINAGIYCVDLAFLFSALREVGTDNTQGEVYLTDIVAIAGRKGLAVTRFACDDPLEIVGVNSRVELARANGVMQQRRNQALMLAGVTMIDPASIFVAHGVSVGRDTEIHSHCVLAGETVIGQGCRLESFCKLTDCQISDKAVIPSFADLQGEVR